jgi:hypothetical protein
VHQNGEFQLPSTREEITNRLTKKLADREGHLNRANTFNLISNVLRGASLSSRSTGQCRLNYTKHNRCRKARLNKTDIATNLQGRNFHITSPTPIPELTAIFRGWRRYIENVGKSKYCIRDNFCSMTCISGECDAISGFDCQYVSVSKVVCYVLSFRLYDTA